MEERHCEDITAVCKFVHQRLHTLETVNSTWLAYFTKFD